MSHERPYWSVIPPLPADMLSGIGQQAEAQGMAGLFAAQVHGAPWIPLAAAAVGTSKLQFATGIAIASVRSPFETAFSAMDMDRLTGGRFTLGLGVSVHAWTKGLHGVPKRKPLTDLRETVEAVRYIIANAHKGLEPFEGTYYQADFADFQPTQPPVRERIPIWTAAMHPPAVRVAGEIADGLMGHPVWSLEYARDRVSAQLEEGLDKAGRERKDIHVNFWPFVLPTDNVREALDHARPTLAFYGGIEQYEKFWAAHGFGEQARRMQPLIKEGKYVEAGKHVPDEMVRTFVAVGSEDEVRARLEEWWGIADSLCPVPTTWGLDQGALFGYLERIGCVIAR